MPYFMDGFLTKKCSRKNMWFSHWYEFLLDQGITFELDDQRFESRQGLGILLFTTASRPVLGPTQPLIQWVRGALSLEVKLLGREADYSPPSSAEVKN
jgi:hypothetical protein